MRGNQELIIRFRVSPPTDGFPDEDVLIDVLNDAVLSDLHRGFWSSLTSFGPESGLSMNDNGTATLTIHCKEFEPADMPLDTLVLLYRDHLKRRDLDLVAAAELVAVEPDNVGLLATERLPEQ